MNNIDILEEFINDYKKVQEKYKDDEIQAEIERSCYFEEVPYQAIEILIAEYKELKEERDIYRSQLNSAFSNGFIHKSKVEEKIEAILNLHYNEDLQMYVVKILQSLLGKE